MSIHGQKNDFKISILGPGAVGGFIASILYKNGYDVVCIGLENVVDQINKKGIIFKSKKYGDFIAKPKAITELSEDMDLIFITVKATGLNDSLNKISLKYTKNTLFLPLLNGIEHVDVLKNKFGDKIIAGAISIEVSSPKPAYVIHSSPFAIIKMAHTGGLSSQSINKVFELMQDIGIEVHILKNEKEVLWGKLVRLNALACTTAAVNKSIGWIRSNNEWRKILEGCANEGSLVAQKDGVEIIFEEVMNQLDNLPENLTSSMQRDVNAGNMPELDAIPGAIIRIGKKYGINCPVIENLINMIKERL